MRSMLVWKRILGTVLTTTCLVLPGNEVYGHKEPVQHKKRAVNACFGSTEGAGDYDHDGHGNRIYSRL
nr:hypothetical protein [Paenibacillus sp. RC343]